MQDPDFQGIDARDVCVLNILQKISREAHRHTCDNFLDIAGYADNAEHCEHDVNGRQP